MTKTLPIALYLATGLATALPAGFAILAAGSMSAPAPLIGYISLVGSFVFVLAAFTSLSDRRLAAKMALAASVAVWSFYAPVVFEPIRIKLSDQQVHLFVLERRPSSEFRIEDPTKLPEALRQQLSRTLATGTLFVYSGGVYGNGKVSNVAIVLDRPVAAKIQLREPDANDIVYSQKGNSFTMFPSNAKTIDRTILLQPSYDGAKQSELMVELATGARQGFGIWFPRGYEETK